MPAQVSSKNRSRRRTVEDDGGGRTAQSKNIRSHRRTVKAEGRVGPRRVMSRNAASHRRLTDSDLACLPSVNLINGVEYNKRGSKAILLYQKGMDVFYRAPYGLISARILERHFDDALHPYYTILLCDGREKQTDNDRLTLQPKPSVPSKNSGTLYRRHTMPTSSELSSEVEENEGSEEHEPDVLPKYLIGDKGKEEDMVIEGKMETIEAVSKLRPNDAVYVLYG